MSAIMPGQPEAVTYHEYEEQRDNSLLPASVHPHRVYTARFREVKDPSVDIYAFDKLTLITAVGHLGHYSLVGAKVQDFNGVTNKTFGVNQQGLIFVHKPLPENLETIPYTAELGYFLCDIDGNGRHELAALESDSTYSPENILSALSPAKRL